MQQYNFCSFTIKWTILIALSDFLSAEMQGILHSSLRLLSWLILLLICRSAFCSLNYWLFSVQWIEYQSESLLHSLLLLLLFFWSMSVFSLASRQWGSIYTFTTLCAPSSLNLCSRLHNLHNKSSESAFVFLFLVANTHKLALKQLCRFGVASLQYNFGFILIIFSLSLSLSQAKTHRHSFFLLSDWLYTSASTYTFI